ncbi:hypothetical protein [Streptomyces antibioticus]|uniref:hypothetical protein n=1 Tax=Streptomyces antibioticus TaxID=1890 RepID=UPI0033BEB562
MLALVLALANMWQHHTEDVGRLVTDAQRRTVVTDPYAAWSLRTCPVTADPVTAARCTAKRRRRLRWTTHWPAYRRPLSVRRPPEDDRGA